MTAACLCGQAEPKRVHLDGQVDYSFRDNHISCTPRRWKDRMKTALKVNGRPRLVDAPGDKPLLWVLREELALSGPKFGCGQGLCGACTVLLDGQAVRSCSTPLSAVGQAAVTTIEGVGSSAIGQRIAAAWVDLDVPQCGYCQAGQIMSAVSLLHDNPAPKDDEIDAAMSGNLCRCGTYHRIRGRHSPGSERRSRDGAQQCGLKPIAAWS